MTTPSFPRVPDAALALLLACVAATSTNGQASIRRLPNGDAQMVAGDLEIQFRPDFGGAPLELFDRGTSPKTALISKHPGEGFSLVYDTGQDQTQASADGVTPNPIATIGRGRNAHFLYYGSETIVQNIGGEAIYEITGFAPAFWLSHEPQDDAIPTNGAGHGWQTPYTRRCTNPCACAGSNFCVDAPVLFASTANHPAGIFLIANQHLPTSRRWNDRLWDVPEGRFAARVRINLKDAAPNAIGSVFFRRFMPTNPSAALQDAFNAPGYSLNINRAGAVEITRADGRGGPPPVVWRARGTPASSTVTTSGTFVELRTQNQNRDRVEIWIDRQFVATYVDANPIYGPHLGLFAQAAPGSTVRFSERAFFDVGMQYVARFTGRVGTLSRGAVDVDFQVRTAPGATALRRNHYPSGVPQAFLDRPNNADLNHAVYWDVFGARRFDPTCSTNFTRVVEVLTPQTDNYSAFLGDCGIRTGIFMTPVRAELDGVAAPRPHAFLQRERLLNGRLALVGATSPLRFNTPARLVSQRMLTTWSVGQPPAQRISVRRGGTAVLPIHAGASLAGAVYVVAGSLSETANGILLPGAPRRLPLTNDSYFLATLNSANQAPLFGSLGVLDAQGRATMRFQIPPAAFSALQGLRLHHAFVVTRNNLFPAVSGAAYLELTR